MAGTSRMGWRFQCWLCIKHLDSGRVCKWLLRNGTSENSTLVRGRSAITSPFYLTNISRYARATCQIIVRSDTDTCDFERATCCDAARRGIGQLCGISAANPGPDNAEAGSSQVARAARVR